jgi:hypothetical protein
MLPTTADNNDQSLLKSVDNNDTFIATYTFSFNVHKLGDAIEAETEAYFLQDACMMSVLFVHFACPSACTNFPWLNKKAAGSLVVCSGASRAADPDLAG